MYKKMDGTYVLREGQLIEYKSDRKTGQRSMDQILAPSCFEEELDIKENNYELVSNLNGLSG